MEKRATLFLVPVGMSDAPFREVLPAVNVDIVRKLKYFIVENLRSARRFLKRCDPSIEISELTFFELNRHTDLSEVARYLEPLRKGEDVGVMSDAGCPAIADPGALVVALAQEEGFRIKPLVGPSSILLGLMASGFNGQGFAFHGYLPADSGGRADALRRLEIDSRRHRMTQIFIETPYRNRTMLETLLDVLHGGTMLCIASDLTDPEREWVRTMSIEKWRDGLRRHPDFAPIDKRPAVFLLYSAERESVQQRKGRPKN